MDEHKKAAKVLWIIPALGLLVLLCWATGLPFDIVPRHVWNANSCVDNLRLIDKAAKQFATQHNLTNGQPINFPNDLTPYLKLHSDEKILACPSGGTYTIGKVGETPTCSLGTNVVPAHVLQ